MVHVAIACVLKAHALHARSHARRVASARARRFGYKKASASRDEKHRWFSGRILACDVGARGLIPDFWGIQHIFWQFFCAVFSIKSKSIGPFCFWILSELF